MALVFSDSENSACLLVFNNDLLCEFNKLCKISEPNILHLGNGINNRYLHSEN